MNNELFEYVRQAIRKEVGKYYDEAFSDDARFVEDMHLDTDDLTLVILSLERIFRIRNERVLYRSVHNVNDLANLILKEISKQE
ncbi:MAG TPA: hypothetical protein VIG90_15160 [Pedomonas sp.]|uniref:hypothetical protein n=1 Tax=Pedomonas sp. TaxID=2976421 RepID=UPI002F419750